MAAILMREIGCAIVVSPVAVSHDAKRPALA
jgi:hypothetical protein